MKRLGKHPQGQPRSTCLANLVHRDQGWGMPTETVRKLLSAHFGEWSPAMTAEEANEFDRRILEQAR